MNRAAQERITFSERLQQSLTDAEYVPDSPTQLAREFNLRYDGTPITVHAARKWIVGEAIPTQEKLRILANWLGVSAEWLRFGGEAKTVSSKGKNFDIQIKPKDLAIIRYLQRLDDKHREIVHTLIRQLAHINAGK